MEGKKEPAHHFVVRPRVTLSVCLSKVFISGTFGVQIQTIYSDLRPNDFLEKLYFLYLV